MPDETTSLQDCVAAGAELLDNKNPLWYTKIELKQFDLTWGERCILGQLYGGYLNGLAVLGLTRPISEINYGFWPSIVNKEIIAEAEQLWTKEIEKRRQNEILNPISSN